ncbi:unnamed protein product [Boreogadus saida]
MYDHTPRLWDWVTSAAPLPQSPSARPPMLVPCCTPTADDPHSLTLTLLIRVNSRVTETLYRWLLARDTRHS